MLLSERSRSLPVIMSFDTNARRQAKELFDTLMDHLVKDLSTAAHEAGFADAAHLTRTSRRMFGFPPSALQVAGPLRPELRPELSIHRRVGSRA